MLKLRPLPVLSILLLTACGAQSPGSTTDAGADAGSNPFHKMDGGTDAGRPDAGHPDAGHPDAGHPDAGSAPDAGVADAGEGVDAGSGMPDAGTPQGIQTVFIILMENHNWSSIKGSRSAPYINSLLPQAASTSVYYNVPGNHPSEPNYIWLEAGQNFGIAHDSTDTSTDSQPAGTPHFVQLLEQAHIDWRDYAEDIDGTTCPISSSGNYAPKHVPMLWFQDVTSGDSTTAPDCIQHVRPYTELAADLSSGAAQGRYNFITPNLCDDMHTACTGSTVTQGDTWLSQQIPIIMNSQVYKNNGAIFITWDESTGGDTNPIGMIVLSPLARKGYVSAPNGVTYTHSSTLRTMQEIFHVDQSFLGDAANATDLSDFFTSFP